MKKMFLAVMAVAMCAALAGAADPEITVDPQNAAVTAPATANFTVTATGTPTLSYQWKRNTVNVTTGTGGTTNSYTTAATTSADNAASFTCVVTNGEGTATSGAGVLTVHLAPAVTTQPATAAVTPPGTGTFTVVASGTPTLSYQWYRNTLAVSGATSASYTTGATAGGDNGAQFACVVTNSYGSAASTGALLLVRSDVGMRVAAITEYPAPTATATLQGVGDSIVVATNIVTRSLRCYMSKDSLTGTGTDSIAIQAYIGCYTHDNTLVGTVPLDTFTAVGAERFLIPDGLYPADHYSIVFKTITGHSVGGTVVLHTQVLTAQQPVIKVN